MADILSIGSSAINSYQRALSTVSNNIANLDTEGYTRQEISLKESTPQSQGQAFFGTGSQFDSIKRAYSAFAESGLRSSYSELNTQVTTHHVCQSRDRYYGQRAVWSNPCY